MKYYQLWLPSVGLASLGMPGGCASKLAAVPVVFLFFVVYHL